MWRFGGLNDDELYIDMLFYSIFCHFLPGRLRIEKRFFFNGPRGTGVL